MRPRVVSAVYRRELRDVLRDRRTLFTMLVVPILLYPALVLGFGKLTQSRVEALKERRLSVILTVGGSVVLPDSKLLNEPLVKEPLLERLFEVERFRFRFDADPKRAVEEGRVQLAVDLPTDLEARLISGEAVQLEPYYRSADEEARAALGTLVGLVEDYRRERWPIAIDTQAGDLATAEERGGRLFGGLVAMMVILMAMTGAFYPALDLGAGEKERGTLETLLLSPASRLELVFGKYLTVLTVAVAAALVNLLSMTFTLGSFSAMLSQAAGGASISIPPGAFVVMLFGLVLVAALFSSVCLALSSFARTYKEGQAWMTPALLLVMPLSMVAMLPDTTLTPQMALLPVANLSLLMKGLLIGETDPRAILITFFVLGGCAVLALKWTTSLYQREDVLFREGPPRFGFKRPAGLRRAVERPSVGTAAFVILGGLAWMFYGSTLGGTDIVLGTVAVHAGLVALGLVALKMTWVPLGRGAGLRATSARSYLAGALVGLGGLLVSASLGQLQELFLGAEEMERASEQLKPFVQQLEAQGLLIGLLVVAVLPALSEELLFRGILLRALLKPGSWAFGAVLTSACVFGAFHQDLARFFPQAVLGIFLALLTLRSGSLWPAMIAHAVHNGTIWVVSSSDAEGAEIPSYVGIGGALIVFAALRLAAKPAREEA